MCNQWLFEVCSVICRNPPKWLVPLTPQAFGKVLHIHGWTWCLHGHVLPVNVLGVPGDNPSAVWLPDWFILHKSPVFPLVNYLKAQILPLWCCCLSTAWADGFCTNLLLPSADHQAAHIICLLQPLLSACSLPLSLFHPSHPSLTAVFLKFSWTPSTDPAAFLHPCRQSCLIFSK